MTERFAYPPTADHAARVSIENGASVATFTNAALGGKDWASAQLIIYPDDEPPFLAGIIADLSPNETDYQDLELPLSRPYNGTTIEDAKFQLVPSIAQVGGASVAALLAQYTASFRQNRGTTGRLSDVIDISVIPTGSWLFDEVTRQIFEKRNGTLEPLQLNPIGASRGMWSGPQNRTEVEIISNQVNISYPAGVDVDGIRYFKVTIDDDCTINTITNVTAGTIVDVLFRYEGAGHTINFHSAYGLTESPIVATDGKQTRMRFIVSAVSGTTAQSIQSELFAYALNDLVQYGEFNFISNKNDNTAEPVVSDAGVPLSDENWTFIRLVGPKGDPGSAIVKALTNTEVTIGAGEHTVTLLGSVEHGIGVGAYITWVSRAQPIIRRMDGIVTAYTPPSGAGDNAQLTFEVAEGDYVGSGAYTDGEVALVGKRGRPGLGAGFALAFDDNTGDMNPGMGEFRLNHANAKDATFAYISKWSLHGSSIVKDLLQIDDSDSTRKARLIFKSFESGKSIQYNAGTVLDTTNYVKIPLSEHDGETGSPFTEGEQVQLEIFIVGDKGESGATAVGVSFDDSQTGLGVSNVQELGEVLAARPDPVAMAIIFGG